MKALVLIAPNVLELRDQVKPVPNVDEVVIKVDLAGIGGSEYLGLANPGIRPIPHVMGHGIIGSDSSGQPVAVYPLEECGDCSFCKTGQKQLCENWTLIGVHSDGGFQQALTVPRHSIVRLPPTISTKQAVFIEPFSNSVNAWEIAAPTVSNSIAVIGAGSLGLGLVACAAHNGMGNVAVAEASTVRREAAETLATCHTSENLDGTYDIVFETVGTRQSRLEAIALTKKGGKCIFLGFAEAEQPINFIELIRHQKQFIGSFVYSRSQFEAAILLAQMCRDDWVKEVRFDDVKAYLEQFQSGVFDVVKLALNPKTS